MKKEVKVIWYRDEFKVLQPRGTYRNSRYYAIWSVSSHITGHRMRLAIGEMRGMMRDAS